MILMYSSLSTALNARNIKFIHLEEIDSTNLYLKRLINGGERQRTVVIADYQTNGKGRSGKSFYSPQGTGLYMSVLLHPNCPFCDAVGVTTAVSVAAARAIEKVCGKQVGIKWVNDLYFDSKKVCGILCEAVNDYKTATAKSVIIGVGINLSTADFPDELKEIAGSLEVEKSLYPALAQGLADEILKIKFGAIDEAVLDEYRRRSIVLGKQVDYYINGEKRTALAVDIDSKGGLVIKNENGEISTLSSGEITLRLNKAL